MYFNLLWTTGFLSAVVLNVLFWRLMYSLMHKFGMKDDEENVIFFVLIIIMTSLIYVFVGLAPQFNWYNPPIN